MNADTEYWAKLSKYDIDTAKAMLESGRYLYVVFTCQQAVEKMIKALVVERTNTFPPKTHDLVRLLNTAGIEATEDQKQFLATLNFYYIETRYPDQISQLSSRIKKQAAEDFYKNTKMVLKWLRSKRR